MRSRERAVVSGKRFSDERDVDLATAEDVSQRQAGYLGPRGRFSDARVVIGAANPET
jgi:hypothetical protein